MVNTDTYGAPLTSYDVYRSQAAESNLYYSARYIPADRLTSSYVSGDYDTEAPNIWVEYDPSVYTIPNYLMAPTQYSSFGNNQARNGLYIHTNANDKRTSSYRAHDGAVAELWENNQYIHYQAGGIHYADLATRNTNCTNPAAGYLDPNTGMYSQRVTQSNPPAWYMTHIKRDKYGVIVGFTIVYVDVESGDADSAVSGVPDPGYPTFPWIDNTQDSLNDTISLKYTPSDSVYTVAAISGSSYYDSNNAIETFGVSFLYQYFETDTTT